MEFLLIPFYGIVSVALAVGGFFSVWQASLQSDSTQLVLWSVIAIKALAVAGGSAWKAYAELEEQFL